MSRASRLRRANRKKPAQRRPPEAARIPCACPDCSGDGEETPLFPVEQILEAASGLVHSGGPFEAEVLASMFDPLASDEWLGEGVDDVLARVAEDRSTGALGVLRALSSLFRQTRPEVSTAATTLADQFAAEGIQPPSWASEFDEPIVVGSCRRFVEPTTSLQMLAASFHRGGRADSFVVVVDPDDCGAAAQIEVADLDVLDDLTHRLLGPDAGDRSTIDPAEWRWWAEEALTARAVHDAEDFALGGMDPDEPDDDLPYPMAAAMLRSRLATMPAARRPKGVKPHRHSDEPSTVASLLDRLRSLEPAPPPKLPAPRRRADGPAPIWQLKVTLKGAKPPIWRRLLVPADIRLGELHRVLQAAFAWDDSHLHDFDTPFGRFGLANADLGIAAEERITLEQVLSPTASGITYQYDYGDGWDHQITVEKVLDRDPSMTYPRCTGGRRAAPPEDCGGIWGYAELIEILADRTHPEHADRLAWLGLADPSEFDPAAFSVDEINRRLPALVL